MKRRRILSTLAAACVGLAFAVGSLLGASPASAATTQSTFLTFYGWYDNTPPGGDISYPKIHSTAGGVGTYADPITFASYTGEIAAGTKVYVPRVQKYFIMEDSCQECQADWTGKGPNGGPNLRHLDLWLGGKGGNEMLAIDCEDALTHYNADNTPTMEPVIVSPPSTETVSSEPLFNTGTGACYGGAQASKTLGQYKNNSTGQCMDDPANSSTSGTALKTAACNGSAEQQLTFEGAFLYIHNLCATISGSSITLTTCTGGPNQQWSVNPDGTISDIQSGSKCITASGTNVVTGSCPGGTAAKWTFTASGGSTTDDFSLAVSPASATVTAGSTATATVSTALVSGTAESVALSATGGPAGSTVTFSPASVTAGGSSTLTVATASGTANGTYAITVTGTAASATHTAKYTLTVGTASSNTIVNGGFETGDFTGWTKSGTGSIVTSPVHGGTHAVRLGSTSPTNGDSKVVQTFTAPTGSTHASFYYNQTCPDDVTYDWATATLKDNTAGTTATVLAKTCTLNAGWKQVTANTVAGHSYTLTLVSHDENNPGDATYTVYDDVTVS